MRIGPLRIEVSREGKVLLLIPAGCVLLFAGSALESPGLVVAGLVLFGAAMLCLWVMHPECMGNVRWHSTEDGEIHIGICNSCDRWQIYIREQPVAFGRGFKEFEAAMERAIQTNQSYLPHLSARLREVLDNIAEPEQKAEEGLELERDG